MRRYSLRVMLGLGLRTVTCAGRGKISTRVYHSHVSILVIREGTYRLSIENKDNLAEILKLRLRLLHLRLHLGLGAKGDRCGALGAAPAKHASARRDLRRKPASCVEQLARVNLEQTRVCVRGRERGKEEGEKAKGSE